MIQLGIQVTDAISAIWDLKKVHRDIKPSNIMRRENGDFVLLDAGLAFDKLGDSVSGGGLVGTSIYFSPEQFEYTSQRTVLDFRSDLFALGVTMHQLATGQHPFYVRSSASLRVLLGTEWRGSRMLDFPKRDGRSEQRLTHRKYLAG